MLNEHNMNARREIGTLSVFAFEGDQARPILGAKVTIKDNVNRDVIASFQTNESGQTESIELAAPEKSLSLTPGNTTPYSKYQVTIEADGYATAEFKGVQIFADTESVQPVQLTPAQRINGRQPIEVVDISEHSLISGETKMSEEAINKELPEDPNVFKVLPGNPIVPSHIIVHDGHPKRTAPKYTVDFKSYITNVACSEIYPTWPTEAIKANIVCIISFTLNRVYTEFYRGKGKDFTITSNTGFDHKYIHRRNIFANISTVVDSIFSEYIAFPNHVEPFLSQYCDGKQVHCPGWLTQWGSKYRADQGDNYLKILNHFYGPQIQLRRAEKVEGIPKSYPGYNLKIGSSGEAVLTIQKFLNRIAKNYPAIKKVNANRVFGQETQAQVKRFQKIFKLPQTGIVNYATWYKISDIYVAVTKMAEGRGGDVSSYTDSNYLNQRNDYIPYTTSNSLNQMNHYIPNTTSNYLNQMKAYTPYTTSNYLNHSYGYFPYIPAYHLNQRNGHNPYITWAPMWIPVLRYW
jgi:hypothetical protein